MIASWRKTPLEKPEFFKLHNQVKHYEWGSKQWIPEVLKIKNDKNLPFAELWMGCHPAAPSKVILPEGETSLDEVIAREIVSPNGEYSSLPFLFKLLAAENPLSIQAHPNSEQAQQGFEAENRAGISLDAPNRNYKDVNHKPEIICALSPFTGMCGFRSPTEIKSLLEDFLKIRGWDMALTNLSLSSGMRPLIRALDILPNEPTENAAALKDFLQNLFALPADLKQEISEYIINDGPERLATLKKRSWNVLEARGKISIDQWEHMIHFAELYPSDAALLSPLYLNLFELEPGDALFLNAGTLHAYIHGFGVELMANSDNVLRGGLTPKHLDIPELIKILDFNPVMPQIIRAPVNRNSFTYPTPCGEFTLVQMCGVNSFYETRPAIAIVVAGELTIQGAQDKIILQAGESVFIPPPAQPLQFSGDYTLYAAVAGRQPK